MHNNKNVVLLKLELLEVCVLDKITFQGEKKGLLTDI